MISTDGSLSLAVSCGLDAGCKCRGRPQFGSHGLWWVRLLSAIAAMRARN